MNGESECPLLFQVVNKQGRTIDFLLIHPRNAKAARAFSGEGAEDTPALAAAGD
jgi:hypothetical protein